MAADNDRDKLQECYDRLKGLPGSELTEPFEVISKVHDYRFYWKPKEVETILLAESHVYTDKKELRYRPAIGKASSG